MLIIGIAGGTVSAKQRSPDLSLADWERKVTFISQDNYYKEYEQLNMNERDVVNYDHPFKKYADLILPEGGHNQVGIQLLTILTEPYLTDDKDWRKI